MRAILIYLSFGFLRFSRLCAYVRTRACVRVHVRLTGKGVAERDWRQNTGNVTTTMAAWIGRNGVYDNRKGIEGGRDFLSLSLSLSLLQRTFLRRSFSLRPPCLTLDPS